MPKAVRLWRYSSYFNAARPWWHRSGAEVPPVIPRALGMVSAAAVSLRRAWRLAGRPAHQPSGDLADGAGHAPAGGLLHDDPGDARPVRGQAAQLRRRGDRLHRTADLGQA